MTKAKFSLIFCVLSLAITQIFITCKKENAVPAAKNYSDTVKSVNEQIYATMKQYYLWYDSLPVVNPDSSTDPQKFINSIVNRRDKWSFILTDKQYQAEFVTGAYAGHGFSTGFDKDSKLRIAYVFNSSDLHTAGVTRGWIIKSVNGIIPDTTNSNTIFGASTAGIQNTFTFTRPDGKDTVLTFVKKEIIRNTVLSYDTLHVGNKVVGYISFLAFELDADAALKTAITYLMQNNATDLVLDLRYNGGGSATTAQNLANMLAGKLANGKPFVHYTYNDKNSRYNDTWNFSSTAVSLNLSRLFVITTHGTASASELIINGLRPYMNVRMIGSRTDGKPVGMNQFQLNYNYYLYPIMFQITNANNYGDYFDGLPVDQQEVDDLTHDFGDRNEACMSQALNYIQYGSFLSTSKAAKMPSKIYHEWEPFTNVMVK